MSGWPFGDLVPGRYGAILADPPWKYETYSEKGRLKCPDWKPFKRSPSLHYDTMEEAELRTLPVGDLAAPDAALFLWIVWPLLEQALRLVEGWGFRYKTCAFSWIKADATQIDLFDDSLPTRVGTGYWTRANSEVCLLATRGHPRRLARDVRQAIVEPRREHSRKPDCIQGRIECLVGGPYVELFARQVRPGWDSWGEEVGPHVPLFQEEWRRDPFWMLVGCVLLNRATWRVAAGVHAALREGWPTAADLAAADPRELAPLVRRLGFGRHRAETLPLLGAAFAARAPRTAADVAELPGCGRYAADSWAIFVEGRRDVRPTDARLREYLSCLA